VDLLDNADIHFLHSLVDMREQRAVFNKSPVGRRKIILSTNIGETSITIDDVVYVVDTGKIKMTTFEPLTNMTTLQPEWVSLSNARQRAGRAGRVQRGNCFHLFSTAKKEK
jgi:ATP-dependent RNA helicase DHX36